MKPLTQKDLPALASLIRYATHLRVYILSSGILILRKNVVVCQVEIFSNGKALSTGIISGFMMRSYHKDPGWPWEIVI
jgi:hypothetical protein